MKRYLFYVVLISLGTLLFAGPPIRQTAQAATVNYQQQLVQNAPKPKVATAPSTAQTATAHVQPTQAPQTAQVAAAPAFDANNPATWPKCATGEVVWAQDGQCHAQVVRAAAPTAVASAPAASTSTGGCVTGYSTGDYYLDKIINYESTGNSCATNAGGCFGLLQACPGPPLRAACGGDPVCQIEWFKVNKTGGRTWAEVWQHELTYGWW